MNQCFILSLEEHSIASALRHLLEMIMCSSTAKLFSGRAPVYA